MKTTRTYRLLPFFLLFFCWNAAAQTQQFVIRSGLKGTTCDSLLKELQVYSVTGTKDSLVLRTSFFECDMHFFLNSTDTLWRLRIISEDGSEGTLNFSTGPVTDSIVDLGILTLKAKTNQLEEFTVTGIKRSFIKIEADKKTITVKDNPILTTSSIYDAIIKIPGVVPFPGGGFAVNGKLSSIYFENIPSSLSGDNLMNLLKSMPATSVESIEIISNPGAAYDANLNGAIINIISQAKVTKYLSGTTTLNYGLNQNNKVLPSLVMSGKNKLLSWQFQAGYSYYERTFKSSFKRSFTSFDPLVAISTERNEQATSGFFYFKPSVTWKIGKRSSLVANYNLSFSNSANSGNGITSSENIAPALSLENKYSSKSKGNNNEFILKYRTSLDTLKRIFSVTALFSDYKGEGLTKSVQSQDAYTLYSLLGTKLGLQRFFTRMDFELPFEKWKFYLNTGMKYSAMSVSNLGRYNLQNPSSSLFDNAEYDSEIDFDYNEQNTAAYIDLKKAFGKKFTLGAGLRAENFSLNRRSNLSNSKRNDYFNLFPSANAIYRFTPDINLIATYSRKISIPSYSQFDPNNSGYYDSFSSSTGNTLLKPNFFDNAELKATVFDYLEFSVNYSHSQTLNLTETVVQPNSLATTQTFRTYNNVNVLTYFFAIPVPFRFFTEGMEFFNQPIDIDKLNFLYLYSERIKTSVGGYESQFPNRPMWNYGVYSQFILPWKIRMNVDGWVGSKGMYQVYDFTKQRSGVEVIFTRDFYDKKLRTSLSFEDIFNQTQNTLRSAFPNILAESYSKDDTRVIWFKVSWSFGRFEKPQDEGPTIEKGGSLPADRIMN